MGITLLSGLMYAASVRSKSKREQAAAEAKSIAENRETHYGIFTDQETGKKSFKSYDLGDTTYPQEGFKVLQVKVGNAAPFSVDYPDENKKQYQTLYHDPHMNDFVTRPEIDTRLKNNLYVNEGFVSEEDVVNPETFITVGQRSLSGQDYLPSDKVLNALIPGFFEKEIEPTETTKQIFINPKFPNKKYDAITYFQVKENEGVLPHIFNEVTKTDKNNQSTVTTTLTNLEEVLADQEKIQLARKGKNKVYQYKGAFVSYNDIAEKIKNKEIDEAVYMFDAQTLDGNVQYEDEGKTLPRIVAGTREILYEPPAAESTTTQEFTVSGKVFDDLYKAIVHAKKVKGRLVAAGASDTDVLIYSKNVTKKGKIITGFASATATPLSEYETKKEAITTTLFRGFNNEGESKIADSQAELKKLGFDKEIQKLEDTKVDITGQPISVGNITLIEQKENISENSYIDVQKIVEGKPNGKTEYILFKDYKDNPDKYMPVSGNIFTLKSDSTDNLNTATSASISELDSLASDANNVQEQSEFGSPIVFETLDSTTNQPIQFPLQTKDSKAGSSVNLQRFSNLLTNESIVKELNADTEKGIRLREQMLAAMVFEATNYTADRDNPQGTEQINFNFQLQGSAWLKQQLPTFFKVKGFANAYDLAMGTAIEREEDNVLSYTNQNVNIPNVSTVSTAVATSEENNQLISSIVPVLLPNNYHEVFKRFANDKSGIWGSETSPEAIKKRTEIVANHIVYKKDERTGKIIKQEGADGKKYAVPADNQPFLDMYDNLSKTIETGTGRSQLELFGKFLAKPMTNVLDDYDINQDMKNEIGAMLAEAANGNATQAISFVKTFIPRQLNGSTAYMRMVGQIDGNVLRNIGIGTNEIDKVKTNHSQRADAAATAIQTLQDMIQTYFDESGNFINLNSWQANLYLSTKGALTIASQIVGVPDSVKSILSLDNNQDMVKSFDEAIGEFTSILDDPSLNLSQAEIKKLEAARDYNQKIKNGIIRKLSSATTEKTKRLAQREYFKYMLAYQMAAAIQGGTGGRTISDQDVQNILRAFNFGIFKSAETEVYSLQAALKMMKTIEAFAKAKGEGGLNGAAAYRAEELLKDYGFGLRKPLTSEMIAHAIKEEGSELRTGSNALEPKTLDNVLPENKSKIINILKRNLQADGIYSPQDDNLSDDDLIKKYQNQFNDIMNSMTTATG